MVIAPSIKTEGKLWQLAGQLTGCSRTRRSAASSITQSRLTGSFLKKGLAPATQ